MCAYQNSRKKNDELQNRVEALESYSRVDNLIITGLPESFAEKKTLSRPSTTTTIAANSEVDASVPGAAEVQDPVNQSENVFLDFCRGVLHVNIQPSDISVCHRLRKTSDRAEHRP